MATTKERLELVRKHLAHPDEWNENLGRDFDQDIFYESAIAALQSDLNWMLGNIVPLPGVPPPPSASLAEFPNCPKCGRRVTVDWEAHEEDCLHTKLEELEASFDLRWKADMKAIKKWQKATGRTLVWPDHADLCVWLLGQF